MTDDAISIGFRNHYITIRSNSPEILRPIERSFRHLLAPQPVNSVRTFEARQHGTVFEFNGVRENASGPVSLEEALRCIKFDAVLQLISANPELIWFHAGAAASQGTAVMILGRWGCGKSTIVSKLYNRGWEFVADDAVPFDTLSRKVLSFPKNPAFRQNPGLAISANSILELNKIEIDVDQDRICTEPVPVSALLFPEYVHGQALKLSRCTASEAALNALGACMNFREHGAVPSLHFAAHLAQNTPAFRLIYGDGEQAAQFIAETHSNWQRA